MFKEQKEQSDSWRMCFKAMRLAVDFFCNLYPDPNLKRNEIRARSALLRNELNNKLFTQDIML